MAKPFIPRVVIGHRRSKTAKIMGNLRGGVKWPFDSFLSVAWEVLLPITRSPSVIKNSYSLINFHTFKIARQQKHVVVCTHIRLQMNDCILINKTNISIRNKCMNKRKREKNYIHTTLRCRCLSRQLTPEPHNAQYTRSWNSHHNWQKYEVWCDVWEVVCVMWIVAWFEVSGWRLATDPLYATVI